MRVCHLDTCPVGVATQNPELRARFTGKPEFVETFFEYLAQEVREYLAELGFRSLDEAIGHSELLDVDRAIEHWKADGLDLSPVLDGPEFSDDEPRRNRRGAEARARRALRPGADPPERRRPSSTARHVRIELPIRNTERAVGTHARPRGHQAPRRARSARRARSRSSLTGSAGQSLGAFMPSGITLRLEGDSNDYVGKGLSGGQIVVRPPRRRDLPGRAQRHRGQRHRLRRDPGQHVHPRRRGGAVPGAQLRCDRRRRGRRRPRARVHDRRPRGHPRRARAATSAPGMSGGTAYVHDLKPERVNRDSLATGELELLPLDSADVEILTDLLREARRRDRLRPRGGDARPTRTTTMRRVREGAAARLRGGARHPPDGRRRGARPRRRRRVDAASWR